MNKNTKNIENTSKSIHNISSFYNIHVTASSKEVEDEILSELEIEDVPNDVAKALFKHNKDKKDYIERV